MLNAFNFRMVFEHQKNSRSLLEKLRETQEKLGKATKKSWEKLRIFQTQPVHISDPRPPKRRDAFHLTLTLTHIWSESGSFFRPLNMLTSLFYPKPRAGNFENKKINLIDGMLANCAPPCACHLSESYYVSVCVHECVCADVYGSMCMCMSVCVCVYVHVHVWLFNTL